MAGTRQQVSLGNGTYTAYAYDNDPRYRLSSVSHYKASPQTLLAQIDYARAGYDGRDNVGNPRSMATTMNGQTLTWTYDYDANNRLDSALAPNFATSGDPTRPVSGQPAGGDYVYDWVGNRIRPPDGTGNEMVYNKVDQLVMWPGMHGRWNGSTLVPGYVYDSAGNLTAVKNLSGGSNVATYTYTDAGLLHTASYGGRMLSNTWDANSNRVGMSANGASYSFVYDMTAGIPAVMEESSASSSVYYIREPGGELIARVSGSSICYYHFDELGSTRLLTDGSGNVTDKYAYDAYGAVLDHARCTGSVDQPYQYGGQQGYYTHYQEPEFGLLQLGVRFYDAAVGRFTQVDRVRRAASSSYVYVSGAPTWLSDPSGLESNWKNDDQWLDDCKMRCEYKNKVNNTATGGVAIGAGILAIIAMIPGVNVAYGAGCAAVAVGCGAKILLDDSFVADACDHYCDEKLANYRSRTGKPKALPSDTYENEGFGGWLTKIYWPRLLDQAMNNTMDYWRCMRR